MNFFRWFICVVVLCAGIAYADDTAVSNRPAHHTDNGFRNPHIEHSDKTVFSYFLMRVTTAEWADHVAQRNAVPRQQADREAILKAGEQPQITWVGHSTFLIQYRGINILTDPMFSTRASPFSFVGPKRYTAPGVAIEQLPQIDYVVISHNHYDHLDAATVERLGNATRWLVPLGHRDWFAKRGVTRLREFDWWDELEEPLLSIVATPSQHWSARGLNDRFKALWASWVIDFGDFRVWFAGDTGYNDTQFRQIGDRFSNVDLALIPIGGYAPRWFMGPMHVNPEEAVQIHLDVNARRSIGMHWGAFPFTAEPVIEPVTRLAKAAQAANLSPGAFTTLRIGETRRFQVCPGRTQLVERRPSLTSHR